MFPESFKMQTIKHIKKHYHDKLEVKKVISNVARNMERYIETSRMEGLAEGELKGKQEGELKGKMEVAQKLLLIGMDIKQIQEVTGLSEEEIRSCRNSQ